jgi:hypothetical protein
MVLRWFVMTLGLISWSLFANATDLEVKAKGTQLLDKANRNAGVIAELKAGESLSSSGREGMFWKVKTSAGKEGYVNFTSVQRVAGQNDALGAAIQKAAHESRDMDGVKTARSRSAVMGVRGLDESSQTANAGAVRPNMRLVYNMEDFVVSQKELDDLENMIHKEIESSGSRRRY